MTSPSLSIGQCATLACLLEVTTPKPGNVHRGADFPDLTFNDFVASAVAIGPAIENAPRRRVGATVLDAIHATRQLVDTNTNLGTVLLLAPLATVPRASPLEAVEDVMAGLDPEDSANVYAAIQLASPGGLGRVDEMDVTGPPPVDLLAAMRSASKRDLVARQYTNQFSEVLGCVVPWIVDCRRSGRDLTTAIIDSHVRLMSQEPDSLIARKCGAATAEHAAKLAAKVLEAGPVGSQPYQRALNDLDFWLRSDHNRRNPGTTADLIAAGLFAALRDGLIEPPFR